MRRLCAAIIEQAVRDALCRSYAHDGRPERTEALIFLRSRWGRVVLRGAGYPPRWARDLERAVANSHCARKYHRRGYIPACLRIGG